MVVRKQRVVLPGLVPKRPFQTGGSGMADNQWGSDCTDGGRMRRTEDMAIVLEDRFDLGESL